MPVGPSPSSTLLGGTVMKVTAADRRRVRLANGCRTYTVTATTAGPRPVTETNSGTFGSLCSGHRSTAAG